MKQHDPKPGDDLEVISRMMTKGQSALKFDGLHMVIWGCLSAIALFVQYFAEVGDWFPSSKLWLWQPVLLIGVISTLYVGRRSLIHRLRNPVIRTYSAAFGAAGITLFIYAVSGLNGGRPDAHTFSVLLCGSLAMAFFVMGAVTDIRNLLWASVSWWLGAVYFGYKGVLDPFDFLVLSALLFVGVVLPGIYLTARQPKSQGLQSVRAAHEPLL